MICFSLSLSLSHFFSFSSLLNILSGLTLRRFTDCARLPMGPLVYPLPFPNHPRPPLFCPPPSRARAPFLLHERPVCSPALSPLLSKQAPSARYRRTLQSAKGGGERAEDDGFFRPILNFLSCLLVSPPSPTETARADCALFSFPYHNLPPPHTLLSHTVQWRFVPQAQQEPG